MSEAENIEIYGITDATVAAHADAQATREAIRLAALADAVWPKSDRRMIELVSELLIEHCLAFAINARRHLSVEKAEGINVRDISGRLPKRYEVTSFSGSLWRAIQMIVHSRSLMVVPIHTGEGLFSQAGDLRVCYLKVADEDGNTQYFCPFGLAHAYLGRHGRTNPGM